MSSFTPAAVNYYTAYSNLMSDPWTPWSPFTVQGPSARVPPPQPTSQTSAELHPNGGVGFWAITTTSDQPTSAVPVGERAGEAVQSLLTPQHTPPFAPPPAGGHHPHLVAAAPRRRPPMPTSDDVAAGTTAAWTDDDPPPRSRLECRQWRMTGHCTFGSRCRFLHTVAAMRENWPPHDSTLIHRGEIPPPPHVAPIAVRRGDRRAILGNISNADGTSGANPPGNPTSPPQDEGRVNGRTETFAADLPPLFTIIVDRLRDHRLVAQTANAAAAVRHRNIFHTPPPSMPLFTGPSATVAALARGSSRERPTSLSAGFPFAPLEPRAQSIRG